jgi:hypothetical protein
MTMGVSSRSASPRALSQGDSWEKLREMVKDAVRGYFFDSVLPRRVRLHFRRDEILELLQK